MQIVIAGAYAIGTHLAKLLARANEDITLIDTDEEFKMRVSVVMRMSHFVDDDHVDPLLDDIATHDNPGYYYRMGAAWAVSMIFVKYPERTRALLESDRLEVWTHNKSIQKIRESLRVPAEVKEELKGLKRRVP